MTDLKILATFLSTVADKDPEQRYQDIYATIIGHGASRDIEPLPATRELVVATIEELSDQGWEIDAIAALARDISAVGHVVQERFDAIAQVIIPLL